MPVFPKRKRENEKTRNEKTREDFENDNRTDGRVLFVRTCGDDDGRGDDDDGSGDDGRGDDDDGSGDDGRGDDDGGADAAAFPCNLAESTDASISSQAANRRHVAQSESSLGCSSLVIKGKAWDTPSSAAMSPTDPKRVTELLTAPASEGDIVAECLLSLVREDGKVVSSVQKLQPPAQEAAHRSLDKDIQRAAAAVLRAEDNLSLVREDGAIGVPRHTPPAQVIERLSAEAAQGDAQALIRPGLP